MLRWVLASVLFFAYVAVAACLVPRLPPRRRALAACGAGIGLLLALAAHAQPSSRVLHDWIVPPLLLLVAYWSTGLLYAAPMTHLERLLAAGDDALRVDRAAARLPRGVAEILELAYAGVYPLVPLALGVQFVSGVQDPERFWTVILVTDYICFGCLAWIQTRPPRAFRNAHPWHARARRLNLGLLGRTSIQVNTFPSGHAAEALAAALLVVGTGWPWVTFAGIAAVLVTLGAVLGRYHYAADAIAGWMVAGAVWVGVNL